MKNKIKSINKIIEYNSKLNIILNFLTICFIIPFYFYHFSIILFNIFGIIILLSWLSNLIFSYLIDRFLIKNIQDNPRLIRKSYRFLIFFSYSILLIMISIAISNIIIEGLTFTIGLVFSYVLQLLGFFVISISSIELSYIVLKEINNKNKKSKKKKTLNIYKTRKKIVKLACYILHSIGIYFVFIFLIPHDSLSPSLAFIIPQFSLFFGFIFLSNTLILLKLIPINREEFAKSFFSFLKIKSLQNRKILRKSIASIGLTLSFIFILPLLSTPYCILHAENEFNKAYGENWRNLIPSRINDFFLPFQFNFYNYFLGLPHRDCNIETDIKYYENQGIQLYFDVYYPKKPGEKLPGNNSIIIMIHSGGWKVGDKGIGNTPIISKYLANQGYVVFDIQYGLMIPEGEFGIDLTPQYVRGDFTLHDMIYQIGNFTKQLEIKYALEYNGNLNSVFIMGRSAGGHLASIIGLGYDDPYFFGNFSTAINIKGVIPLYPPNFAGYYFNNLDFEDLIPGDPETNPLAFEKFTPSNLVSLNDPPVLIFQGTQDRLVPPVNTEKIENSLETMGVDCIRLIFPFATHGNDMITHNFFAQIWLYYLERFLYLNT